MALVNYQNYTFPLQTPPPPTPYPLIRGSRGQIRGLGQTTTQPGTAQTSWIKRNWGTVLQVMGSLFVVSGTIVQQWLNKNLPTNEQIATDDWEAMVQSVQRMYPQLSRQDIEKKLCEVFGSRSPYCLPSGGQIYPAPPPTTGMPSWIWLAAIGAGAFLLLR